MYIIMYAADSEQMYIYSMTSEYTNTDTYMYIHIIMNCTQLFCGLP